MWKGEEGQITWREFMAMYFKDVEAIELFTRSVATALSEIGYTEGDVENGTALGSSPLLKGQVMKSSIDAVRSDDGPLFEALGAGVAKAAYYSWFTDLEGSEVFISVDDFISSYASLQLE